MKSQKKVILSALLTMAILTCGTLTAVAASAESPNIETAQETESCIILGKDAEKEPDGIAKVSFDLGKTWLSESEALYSEMVEVEDIDIKESSVEDIIHDIYLHGLA